MYFIFFPLLLLGWIKDAYLIVGFFLLLKLWLHPFLPFCVP